MSSLNCDSDIKEEIYNLQGFPGRKIIIFHRICCVQSIFLLYFVVKIATFLLTKVFFRSNGNSSFITLI